MKPIAQLIFFIFLCTLLGASLPAQNKENALKTYFATLSKNQQFNGSILVAEKGKIVYQESFGYADFEKKIANTEETSFVIASISKTFTATAVLQLAQSGKFKLEDPVKKHLSWFPYEKITIAHLLSHTSGLPAYNAFFDSIRKRQPERIFTNADFSKVVAANPKPLLYTPGDKGNYDNVNYIVLALLIEKYANISYQDYIERYILKPANMSHTRFIGMRNQYTDNIGVPIANAYLFPHRYSDNLLKPAQVPYIANYWSAYNFSGFGDYISTIGDLYQYDQIYYGDELLSKTLKEQAFTAVKLNDGKTNPGNYGLGCQIAIDSTFGKVIFNNGNATGVNCTLLRNISKQQTIIIFDNIHFDNAKALSFDALKILNGVSVPKPKKNLTAIYARALLSDGAAAAKNIIDRHKNDTLNYHFTESDMNLLGYDFMGGTNNPNPFRFPEENKYPEALETFRFNTELFPDSWNVYDSYGEILLKMDQKEEAIKMYKKSLELNPQNESGRKILAELSK